MVMNMNDLILINENARASQYDQLKTHREAPGTATSDFLVQFMNVRNFAGYGLKYVIYIC